MKQLTEKNYLKDLVPNPITILILVTIKVALTSSQTIDFKCSYADDFYYTTPLTLCTSYYKCSQNNRIKYNCPSGSKFDFYKQKCLNTAGICYEQICTGRTDGEYEDTTQACRRFFRCSGGEIVGYDNCPRGYLHDGKNCKLQKFVTCDLPKSTAVALPFIEDHRCEGIDNGYSSGEDIHCKSYVVCRSEMVVSSAECPDGQLYDKRLKHCVLERETSCNSKRIEDNELCRNLQDGLHVDPSSKDCKKYMKCFNGKLLSRNDCSPGTVFDGSSCGPNSLFECSNSPRLDKLCKGKPNGLFSDPRSGCIAYMRCVNEHAISFHQCISGQIFDVESKSCKIDSSKSLCKFIGKSDECSTKELGYYQDRSVMSSCRDYFFCYNSFKTNFRCELGKLFNGENCVDERLYTCPNRDSNSCDNKADGYYKDNKIGCRAYYYCSGGKKYSYVCNNGQAFDGTKQKCVEKRHVQPQGECSKNSDCGSQPDGYYQDLKSQCRNYYYCLQGDKVQVLTCRNGRLFNGQGCVASKEYTCPSIGPRRAEKLNCVQRKCEDQCSKMGFYPDLASGCKNYFFCVDGQKTSLSCSNGSVFNGEMCVPYKSYHCPKYCSTTCTN